MMVFVHVLMMMQFGRQAPLLKIFESTKTITSKTSVNVASKAESSTICNSAIPSPQLFATMKTQFILASALAGSVGAFSVSVS